MRKCTIAYVEVVNCRKVTHGDKVTGKCATSHKKWEFSRSKSAALIIDPYVGISMFRRSKHTIRARIIACPMVAMSGSCRPDWIGDKSIVRPTHPSLFWYGAHKCRCRLPRSCARALFVASPSIFLIFLLCRWGQGARRRQRQLAPH